MHYFDWTATTRPTEGVIEKVNTVLAEEWGNPSSVHGFGGNALRIVETARREILRGLGFGREAPGRLIFTSGGTEANNLAILGSAYAKAKRGCVLITEGEHASVEMCADKLAQDGFTVIRIPTAGGRLDIDAIRNAPGEIVLASFMMVNNETGALYDIAAAAKAVRAKSPGAFIHCDGVQGFMKVRFTPERLGVNAVSVSAHKIGGLKGTGALYIDRDSLKQKRLLPTVLGGGQESGYRSGTENVPGIAAFGEAVREAMADFAPRRERTAKLRQYLTEKLAGTPLRINSNIGTSSAVGLSDLRPSEAMCRQANQANAEYLLAVSDHDGAAIDDAASMAGAFVPGIVSITVPGIKSETVVNYLSSEGYCISAGSACSSHGHGASRALTGFGLTEEEADHTVRISLCHLNSEEEIDGLAKLLIKAAEELGGLRQHI